MKEKKTLKFDLIFISNFRHNLLFFFLAKILIRDLTTACLVSENYQILNKKYMRSNGVAYHTWKPKNFYLKMYFLVWP